MGFICFVGSKWRKALPHWIFLHKPSYSFRYLLPCSQPHSTLPDLTCFLLPLHFLLCFQPDLLSYHRPTFACCFAPSPLLLVCLLLLSPVASPSLPKCGFPPRLIMLCLSPPPWSDPLLTPSPTCSSVPCLLLLFFLPTFWSFTCHKNGLCIPLMACLLWVGHPWSRAHPTEHKTLWRH